MRWLAFTTPLALCSLLLASTDPPLDKTARRWMEKTMATLTVDEKVGQLLMPSFESSFMSTDSDAFDRLQSLVTKTHVGGFLVFGASEPVPPVLLNATYGSVILGQAHAAAATLNRLQAVSAVPLLNSADFEFGVGMRIAGGTQFPRAMAFGAAGDPMLAEQAGRIVAEESRAIGVHVDFAPVADVNDNPRNPVINTRSFGEDPQRVGLMASAFVRGLRAGGVIATIKHFPGHGDTAVDTHLGFASIPHDRARLDAIELAPFRQALAAGADAIMVAHVALPALDASGAPATMSAPIVGDLLRQQVGFEGLVFTDSMSMAAIARMASPGETAVRAIAAGADIVLHSPDDAAAADALKAAVASGRISMARLDASVQRLLTAKARLGLHLSRAVDLGEVASHVGGRQHAAVARTVSERSLTLVRNKARHVPLEAPRSTRVLVLSVLDYPGNWRIAAPGRTFIPAIRERWPDVTAIELTDRTTPSELDLVRASAPGYGAIVMAIYVRAASGSGRLDLAPPVARLVNDMAPLSTPERPVVAVFFGNPYAAASVADVPAMLLTYDFGDLAEASAVRALAGEIPVRGKLPIAIPEIAAVGEGLALTSPRMSSSP
jgi:beta-glucosidase-like glycosyl hydrolase